MNKLVSIILVWGAFVLFLFILYWIDSDGQASLSDGKVGAVTFFIALFASVTILLQKKSSH